MESVRIQKKINIVILIAHSVNVSLIEDQSTQVSSPRTLGQKDSKTLKTIDPQTKMYYIINGRKNRIPLCILTILLTELDRIIIIRGSEHTLISYAFKFLLRSTNNRMPINNLNAKPCLIYIFAFIQSFCPVSNINDNGRFARLLLNRVCTKR